MCIRDRLEDYRKHCITLGKEVHVLGREPFFAEALDITPEGELLVDVYKRQVLL